MIKFNENELIVINLLNDYINFKNINIYIVGGFVRNKLLNLTSEDIDLIIDTEDLNIFVDTFEEFVLNRKDIKFSIVKNYSIKIQSISFTINNISFDATIPRNEIYTLNSNIPKIQYVSIDQDIIRRDITINSFIIDPLRLLRVLRFSSKLKFNLHPDIIKVLNNDIQMKKILDKLDIVHIIMEYNIYYCKI